MKLQLAGLFLLAWLCQNLDAREWSDISGKHRFEGELVRYDASKVWLLGSTGKTRTCKWELLSKKDQEYVREFAARTSATLSVATEAIAPDSLKTAELPSVTGGANRIASLSESRPRQAAFRALSASSSIANNLTQPPGKRIFSGYRSTFQLNGATGTGAYWFRGSDGCPYHYLTSLTFHGYDASGKYLIYTSIGTDGGAYGWYFYDQEACGCDGSPVYYIGAAGKPKFYESDYREIPN